MSNAAANAAAAERSIDARQLGLARLYARALLEVAEESGQAEELTDELAELDKLLATNRDLAGFIASPLHESEDRRASLEKLFRGRASDLLVDSLQVINRKGRLGLLPAIAAAYRHELSALRGRVDVEVTSAVELSAEQHRRLQEAADRFTGRKASLIEKVDASILGGLVLRVGDDKIDSSVATGLAGLAEILSVRASQEILKARAYTADS